MGSWKELTRPMEGIYFNLFGALFHINVAKTLIWAKDSYQDGEEERVYCFVTFSKSIRKDIGKLYRLIIGPFSFTIGVSK